MIENIKQQQFDKLTAEMQNDINRLQTRQESLVFERKDFLQEIPTNKSHNRKLKSYISEVETELKQINIDIAVKTNTLLEYRSRATEQQAQRDTEIKDSIQLPEKIKKARRLSRNWLLPRQHRRRLKEVIQYVYEAQLLETEETRANNYISLITEINTCKTIIKNRFKNIFNS